MPVCGCCFIYVCIGTKVARMLGAGVDMFLRRLKDV